jgi:hypothetical protein
MISMARLFIGPHDHHEVELPGRRWTGPILRTLLNGPARDTELRARIPVLPCQAHRTRERLT